MRIIRILSTGEVKKVPNNEAHNLIDQKIAELVVSVPYSIKPMDGAGVLEPQSLRQSSSPKGKEVRMAEKGTYLTK